MIRALLIWSILGYRRWLSGRGPLRQVRCTFHHSESCSAFGLRAAREAPDVRAAVARIRRRLRRCREASTFMLQLPGGGRALGWGRDHERPLDELVTELVEDAELPAARATVLSARGAVARWRGDVLDVVALAPHLRALPSAKLVVRRPPSRSQVARRLLLRFALGAALVGAVALFVAPVALGLAAALTLGVAAAGRGYLVRGQRLRAQARAAALRASA